LRRSSAISVNAPHTIGCMGRARSRLGSMASMGRIVLAIVVVFAILFVLRTLRGTPGR
jgi:hypothetical protein